MPVGVLPVLPVPVVLDSSEVVASVVLDSPDVVSSVVLDSPEVVDTDDPVVVLVATAIDGVVSTDVTLDDPVPAPVVLPVETVVVDEAGVDVVGVTPDDGVLPEDVVPV